MVRWCSSAFDLSPSARLDASAMRYPPAISIQPQGSSFYRALVLMIAILLIANFSINTWANDLYSFQNTVLAVASGLALAWAWVDAWRRPAGRLRYAQGQWCLEQADQSITGTLSLHLDLQIYMLVRFHASATSSLFTKTTTQWFHLQAGHVDLATWLALRRAVHSAQQSAPLPAVVRGEGVV
jgi:hypothetical protein